MKGIILAGGNGSRLFPVTSIASKQLLPVYDKPMIYYPLSTLMLLGIREIMIITTPDDIERFRSLFGNGSHLGLKLTYEVQPRPEGIAQALIIGEEFVDGENVALILGDNIFFGDFSSLRAVRDFESGAMIFAYNVNDPSRYGVIELDEKGNAISIEEKPANPRSSYVVTGMYIYSPECVKYARELKLSPRGEYEITDVNRAFMEDGKLQVIKLGRGIAWLDTGTHESMLEAGNFIATIEKRQGLKVACIEEIAYRMGYIDKEKLGELVSNMAENSYRKYLENLINEVKNA
jgi:glucose-1-phosphate thymidylyltransferase